MNERDSGDEAAALAAILGELLADRRFRRVWIDELATALETTDAAVEKIDAATSPICDRNDAQTLVAAVDRLVVGIQLAIETFLRGRKRTFFNASAANNRVFRAFCRQARRRADGGQRCRRSLFGARAARSLHCR